MAVTVHRNGLPAPFVQVPGKGGARPRLLLLSYNFPPARTAGALRWQKLAHCATERGWEMDVVTADPAELAAVDASRVEDLPPGIRVWGVASPESRSERAHRGLLSLVHALRSVRRGRKGENAAAGAGGSDRSAAPSSIAPEEIRWSWRDRQSYARAYSAWIHTRRDAAWARAAGELAGWIVQPGVHRAVITCGPPHMVHDAGRRLSVRTGLPLILDLRDPWAIRRRLPVDHASPLAFALAERYERRTVAQASLVVTNTDAVRDRMRQAHPRAAAEFLTVMNGFDEEAVPERRPSPRFTIAYAGAIYLDRDPRLLFRAAARVAAELGLTDERFSLELIGNVENYGGVPTSTMAEEEGVGDFVTVGPARPRAEALDFLSQATMLVSLPQDSPWAIPSKIFEYMNFRAWILALTDPGTPAEVVLRGTDADVVAPRDVEGIARVIRARYLEHAAGGAPPRLADDARFSRRTQGSLLFDALEEHAGAPRPYSASPDAKLRAALQLGGAR